ncbi:MAG: hypothetical protein ABFD91_01195 [Anaerohalosphaeraceae bacterium]
MKEKLFVCGLICFTAVGFIFAKLHHNGSVMAERGGRICNLQVWRQDLMEYLEQHDRPDSLYAYCCALGDIPYQKMLSGHETKDTGELLSDPNLFGAEVEYAFYSNPQGWCIIEKGEGFYCRDLFMIDDQGNVYQMKRLGGKLR